MQQIECVRSIVYEVDLAIERPQPKERACSGRRSPRTVNQSGVDLRATADGYLDDISVISICDKEIAAKQ